MSPTLSFHQHSNTKYIYPTKQFPKPCVLLTIMKTNVDFHTLHSHWLQVSFYFLQEIRGCWARTLSCFVLFMDLVRDFSFQQTLWLKLQKPACFSLIILKLIIIWFWSVQQQFWTFKYFQTLQVLFYNHVESWTFQTWKRKFSQP